MSAMPNVGFPQRAGDRVDLSEILAGIFRSVRARSRRAGRANSRRVLRHHAGTYSRDGSRRGRQAAGHGRPRGGCRRSGLPKRIPVAAREPESALWRKIQAQQFVISVEIDPPKGTSIDRVLEQVQNVMASKQVDAIDINSGPLARVGMDALSLAGALEARGIETIPHLTTRDANLIGLQAMLLGAWTVGGVRNVLAITGDPPSLGSYPESLGVYEVDSIGLVKVMATLESRHRLGAEKSRRRDEFHHRRCGESAGRGSGRGIAPVSLESRSRSALRHDPADFRSRTLGAISETHGRKIADPHPGGPVAAEQLQAGPASA